MADCHDVVSFIQALVLKKVKLYQIFFQLIRSDKGPFLTSPLGANFDPRVEVVP
jgi:hypothetical protein